MKVLIEFQWFSALVVLSLALEASAFRSSESNQDKAQRMDGASSEKLCSSQLLSQLSDVTMPTRLANHRSRKGKVRKKKNRKKQGIATEQAPYHHDASNFGNVLENQSKESIDKQLDRYPTLVLNADYTPISYLPLSKWHWHETIKSVFSGKVTVVDVYPEVVVRASRLEVPLPSVIALNDYVQKPNGIPAFTRRNVFLRDEFRCQYCGRKFYERELSLDHVLPRCKGGQLCWENTVASCMKCNGRKGSLTVNELNAVGMKLMKEPFTPTQYQLHKIAGKMVPKDIHPSWSPYLEAQTQGQ
eukprot:CAMPEP_0178912532 /NCGR_PEP_ID=MMETSP0786-20121207/10320_1 /TAXON_ID=186022 /ORGANISM="Thalassionema frauenfeldii, Strain CCMP 1798" /LENGTH=300 /DNA_ID=CAMNT_0020585135 /DNA_START=195 /DNA_END=1097 /DNA_ORIENTATION=+